MDKEFPLSVEETGGAHNAGRGATLPGDPRDLQQAVLRSLSTASIDDPCVRVIVKYGNLEQQKVDVLAYPLLAIKPHLGVLNITKDLQAAAGPAFSNLFSLRCPKAPQKPGHCIQLPTAGGSYSLHCQCVLFIICSIWSNTDNSPEKDLRAGIRSCLDSCHSMRGVTSVALSAVGTGVALNFPNEVAARIMGEEIKSFVARHPDTGVREIQIVIKQLQNNETVHIAYREVLLAMDLGRRIKLCDENGGCFNTIAHGEHAQKKAGSLSVTVVYGDIVKESTNAIVNPTNFTTWGDGSVAKSVYMATGNDIVEEARKGHDSGDKLVLTTAGRLTSQWILHCNCGGKLDNISKLVSEILQKCEYVGHRSVAIPAIGTGECKLRPENVAGCMMEGISNVAQKTNLKYLSCVRIVTYSPYIYHTFCAELKKRFI